MKYLLITLLLLRTVTTLSQSPCDYDMNVTDSLGSYKSTKEYLMSEKIFAGNSNYIFYSLALSDGMPILNVQLIQKSKGFLKVNCFDKNSKLYLQLNNGKIVTLLHIDQENCGTMIRDDKNFDNRVTSGTFMFLQGSIEELKNSPVSLMKIKFVTESEEFIIKKDFVSELNGEEYKPDTFFIENLHCVE
jgi:hypothetical protein